MENISRNTDCWYVNSCKDDCYMCNTYLEMKWQMNNSGLPATMQKPIKLQLVNKEDEIAYDTLATIRKNIRQFVIDSKNLYICGESTGTGKTSWAIKLLQTYLHYTAEGNYENLKGMFVSVPDLLLKLKDFNNPLSKEYKDNLEKVDLVVWDDIALTNASNYDYMQLYTYINNRLFAGKSNIYTSNITTLENLTELLGSRIASRVWNTSEVIEFKGKDIR